MGVKILFLVPYPLKASPSQRFRFEQYFSILESKSYTYEVQSFLNSHNWQLFFKPGKAVLKAIALLNGFLKRCAMLFKAPAYDFIFIHREVTPIGPPVFEWLLIKILQKKIIYDFDDAIWLTDRAGESFFLKIGKWRSKVKSICRWSYKVSCGNDYLCQYALQFNRKVFNNPTTIDTVHLHNPAFYLREKRENKINIGWTGSHSTLKYLHEVEEILRKIISENNNINVVIIADKRPNISIPYEFIPWNADSEIKDLLTIDIGIMPLPDDEWAKGKCGFKALQYMALDIPAVVSPVGVNTLIIDHNRNGFLASTKEEWYNHLNQLIHKEELRKKIGASGRKKVEEYYSVNANSRLFLSLFE